MARAKVLKRKSFFVDERALARARKVLGAASDAEAIRLSVERMAEMEEFWRQEVEQRLGRPRVWAGPRRRSAAGAAGPPKRFVIR